MKYVVLTAKHHEGFCLWDSKVTDYKVTNTPYGKDLIRPYVEALQAEGLKVGFYYSLLDWHHPDLERLIRSDGVRLYTPARNDTLYRSTELLNEFASTNPDAIASQWWSVLVHHPLDYLGEPDGVDPVRAGRPVRADPVGAPAQQGHRAGGIAA